MEFTQEQKQVIFSRNKNLIVSAAAGSGKTSVMIERIKELITKQRVPISKFLIVTFTKASAADMKAKLVQKLSSEQPDAFVLEQIEDIATADVSNLHSFCARLLKTYFYEAGLDPTFVVLSDTETAELKEKALSELFEEKIEQNNNDFYVLFDCLQQNRSDRELRNTILKLHDFFGVIFNRDRWFNDCINSLYAEDLNKNKAASIINGYACGRIEKLQEQITQKISEFDNIQLTSLVAYLQDVQSELKTISARNSYQKNAKNIFQIEKFKNLPTVDSVFDERKKELSDLVDRINDEITNLKKNYISDDAELVKRQLAKSKKLATELYEATNRFEEIYNNLKAEKCGLDYNDLEHYALKVLENKEIRETLVKKYDYVFVDEYQDINDVQEKIITLLSRSNNRFMVGDVKQSVYGFRLCDPSIFLKKYDEYNQSENSEAINLSKNFRSNKTILNFVNMVFNDRMTKDFGGIDYKNNAELVAGLDFEEQNPVTLAYLNTQDLQTIKSQSGAVQTGQVYSVKNHIQEEEQEKLQQKAEAEYIVSEILDLVANKTIFDDKQNKNRPIRFKDIAILISARNSFLTTLLESMSAKDIPYSTDATLDILNDEYIKCILSYLKLIYNEHQDIELFSVLYSPLTDFTLNELAELRSISPKCKFYYQTLQNLAQIEQKNAKLAKKVLMFNEKLQKYQKIAGYVGTKELAKRIISDSCLENIVSTEADGEQRIAILNMFLDILPNDNLHSYMSNFNLTELLAERPANENAVQIVTIHKSKGLEYKVAMLANTNKNFNLKDTTSHMLVSKHLGIGIDYFDEILREKNVSLAKEAIKLTMTKNIIEEQQRVLYVALTRAINKLYVVCSKDFDKIKTIFPERKNSFSDWFDPFVYQYNCGEAMPFDIHLESAENYIAGANLMGKKDVVFGAPNVEAVKNMQLRANKKYEYYDATIASQKTSVTEIASGITESEEVFDRYSTSKSTSSTTKGNAYHKLMQYIDFSANTAEKLEKNMQELMNSSKISKSEADLINKNAILKLLNNPEFLDIIKSGTVLREKEFFYDIGEQDVQIVQGVIDLAVLDKNNGGIIVDYKTGNYNSPQKLAQYKKQLSLYSEAAKRAFDLSKTKIALVAIEEGKIYYFD